MARQASVGQDVRTDTMVEAVFGTEAAVQYVPDMSGMQQFGNQVERAAMTSMHRETPQAAPRMNTQREKVNTLLVDEDISELQASQMARGEEPAFV